ncbi:hypothetical protein T484DRAFT_1884264 [Baffinella frigidus]|nr:hypothetical protein T484DRAFT_1884264 [Cryptophyta sp. CCMP2293]
MGCSGTLCLCLSLSASKSRGSSCQAKQHTLRKCFGARTRRMSRRRLRNCGATACSKRGSTRHSPITFSPTGISKTSRTMSGMSRTISLLCSFLR